MTNYLVIGYLIVVMLTFPIITSGPQIIEETPFVFIAAIIGAFAWPLYWPYRLIARVIG